MISSRNITYMMVRGIDMLRQMQATKEWERRMIKELERDFELVPGSHDEWRRKEKP